MASNDNRRYLQFAIVIIIMIKSGRDWESAPLTPGTFRFSASVTIMVHSHFLSTRVSNMRKVLFILLLLLIPFPAFARDYPPFLDADSLPDGVKFLPAPPGLDNPLLYCDWNMYAWGKTIRSTPRGQQAIEDAKIDKETLVKRYGNVLGLTLSESKTPHIYALIARTADSVMLAVKRPKKHHQRTRPYSFFNEYSLIPEEEAGHNPNASYPSGHSAIGWGVALVLAELAPESQEAILQFGYELGESRIIAGYHFLSDVQAARLLASATVARLHADPEFVSAMQAAKTEYQRLSKRKSQK